VSTAGLGGRIRLAVLGARAQKATVELGETMQADGAFSLEMRHWRTSSASGTA
jgi:hypothetical protein